jgi:hypothetical protein
VKPEEVNITLFCSWTYFDYDRVCCSGVRPFGVSLLIAGYDDNGPQLYQVWTEIQNRFLLPLVIVHCSTDDIIFISFFNDNEIL